MDFQKSVNFQIQVCRHSVYQAPVSGSLADTMTDLSTKRAYTRIGMYKGNIVAIKQIHKRSVDLTRSIRKELKQVIYIQICNGHTSNSVYLLHYYLRYSINYIFIIDS